LIQNWARNDPKAAGEWLQQAPVGKARDQGLGAYSQQISQIDVVSAAQWANSISDDKMRDQYVQMSYRRWAKQDSAAASAWLATSAVSDDLKKRLQPNN